MTTNSTPASLLQDASGSPIGVVIGGKFYRLVAESGLKYDSSLPTTLSQLQIQNSQAQKANVLAGAKSIALNDKGQLQFQNGDNLDVKSSTRASEQTLASRASSENQVNGSHKTQIVGPDGRPLVVDSEGKLQMSGVVTVSTTGLATDQVLASRASAATQTDGSQKTQIVNGNNVLAIDGLGRLAVTGSLSATMDSTGLAQETTLQAVDTVLGTISTNIIDVETAIGSTNSLLSTLDSSVDAVTTALVNGTQLTRLTNGVNFADVDVNGHVGIQNPPNMNVALATRSSLAAQTDGSQKTQIVQGANTLAIDATGKIGVTGTMSIDTSAIATNANQTNGNHKTQIVNGLNTLAIDGDGKIGVTGTMSIDTSAISTAANQTNGTQRSMMVNGANVAGVDANGRVAIQNQPNMDVAVSTLATQATLATRASATNQTDGNQKTQLVNGVNTAGINASGQVAIQNPPNLNTGLDTRASESTLTQVLKASEFFGRIGEVIASPTANTVLERLKAIADKLPVLGPQLSSASQSIVFASDVTGMNVSGTDGTINRQLKTDQSGRLLTREFNEPTHTVTAAAIAPANNKSMLSIFNTGVVPIRIREIYIVNVQTTNVTGIIGIFQLNRFLTAHGAGTDLSFRAMDTADVLPAGVTAKTNGTIAGEDTVPLKRTQIATDEWAVGTLDKESFDAAIQGYWPIYQTKSPMKPITLRVNEGISVKFATNSAVGSFDIVAVISEGVL